MRRAISLFCQVTGGALILALVIIVSAEVIGRSAFDHSFLVADEYSGYIAVMITFLGIPYAMDENALLRVDVFRQRIGRGARRYLDLFFHLAALSVSVVLTFQLARMAWRTFERGTFAATPARTPLWIPQSAMALGMVLLVLVILLRTIALARQAGGAPVEDPER